MIDSHLLLTRGARVRVAWNKAAGSWSVMTRNQVDRNWRVRARAVRVGLVDARGLPTSNRKTPVYAGKLEVLLLRNMNASVMNRVMRPDGGDECGEPTSIHFKPGGGVEWGYGWDAAVHGGDCPCPSCRERFCQREGCGHRADGVFLGMPMCDACRSGFVMGRVPAPPPSRMEHYEGTPFRESY